MCCASLCVSLASSVEALLCQFRPLVCCFNCSSGAALHAHILLWLTARKLPPRYQPIRPVPRTAPGTDPRQRPVGQVVHPLPPHERVEDHVYHVAHVGRITAELVRPDVTPTETDLWGGYDVEKLRIAGLARGIQTRLPYLHNCSGLYCLKNRSTCHFFFPTRP